MPFQLNNTRMTSNFIIFHFTWFVIIWNFGWGMICFMRHIRISMADMHLLKIPWILFFPFCFIFLLFAYFNLNGSSYIILFISFGHFYFQVGRCYMSFVLLLILFKIVHVIWWLCNIAILSIFLVAMWEWFLR